MKKKFILIKIIIVFILIALIYMQNPNNIYAMDEIITSADDFVGTGESATSPALKGIGIAHTTTFIYTVFFSIAVAAALIVATYLGVKFMMASAVEKAEVKESMLVFIIGCIVAFGAIGLWRVAVKILYSI